MSLPGHSCTVGDVLLGGSVQHAPRAVLHWTLNLHCHTTLGHTKMILWNLTLDKVVLPMFHIQHVSCKMGQSTSQKDRQMNTSSHLYDTCVMNTFVTECTAIFGVSPICNTHNTMWPSASVYCSLCEVLCLVFL